MVRSRRSGRHGGDFNHGLPCAVVQGDNAVAVGADRPPGVDGDRAVAIVLDLNPFRPCRHRAAGRHRDAAAAILLDENTVTVGGNRRSVDRHNPVS